MKIRSSLNIRPLLILSGLFIAAILSANTLASKLFDVGGYVMTAGIIAFPITFLITDIVNELWGRKVAQNLVIAGFVANILMVGLYQLGVWLSPAGFWEGQEAFSLILGAVPRIVFSSMVAYLISQTWDVWVFDYIKRNVKVGLWFRNNISTITSQIIDSAIFLTLAFYGVMPMSSLITMFITYVIAKFIIALLDTPFVYFGVSIIRGKKHE